MYTPGGLGFVNPDINEFFFFNVPTPSSHPEIYSASNRNEYQKQENNVSGEQSTAGA
jgi:hypothetical protein